MNSGIPTISQRKLERHKLLCDRLHDLYCRKNADYGDAFHKVFLEEGVASCRIRLSDKLYRFRKLTQDAETQKVKEESITDTLIDLANYALLSILELEFADEET